MQGTTHEFVKDKPQQNFNPRSHCRERHRSEHICKKGEEFQSTFPLQGTTFFSAPIVLPAKIFQSTFPLQGTTEQIKPFIEAEVISIHVPIAGNDTCDPTLPVQKQNFNPRSHCRERHNVGHCSGGFSIFQSTFPLQGTTTVSMHMIGLP